MSGGAQCYMCITSDRSGWGPMGLTLFTSHNWHYWQAKRLHFRYSLAFIGGWSIQRLESVALHPCQDNDKEEEGVRSARRIRNQAATNYVHTAHTAVSLMTAGTETLLVLRNPRPLVFVMVCHVQTLINTVSLASILNQKYRLSYVNHYVDRKAL